MSEIDEAEEALASSPRRSRARRPQGFPWTRALLALAIAGPPLWLGGTRPEVVIAFVAIALALWWRTCTRSGAPLLVPRAAGLGALLVGVTALQWLPLPGLREALAPDIAMQIETALAESSASAWPSLSPTPGDTGLEAARLVGLLALFVAAAQLSWRASATIVAATGCLVALVGFAHEAFGIDAIYGRYAAEDIDLAGVPALLTTFVNPNHQSSLLLLGVFTAGALAHDQHAQGLATRDPAKVDRYADRHLAAIAALGVQLPALVLSLSRGALVALAIVGPVALWLGLRRDPSRKTRAKRQRHMTPLRWVGLAGLLGILVLVAQHGAWRELATLADVTDPSDPTVNKLRVVGDVPVLVGMSPWLGIGRGAFIDLYPPVDPHPSHVLLTHLESTPATAIVEWGPLVGGAAILGVAIWWWGAWRRDPDRSDLVARRIALLGLFAVALHSVSDFALEFLGVTAAVVALAGGLSPTQRWQWPVGRAKVVLGVPLAIALGLAIVSAPHAFSRRDANDRAMQRDEIEPDALLRMRPLDGRLHGLLARRAAERGDWAHSRARAIAATARAPGAIDGYLLLAAAESELGRPAESEAAMRAALERLHEAPAEDLRDWLLARHPDPQSFAALTPDDAGAWQSLVVALVDAAPEHADAIAAARMLEHADDPAPLRVRTRLALVQRNAALALHYARLWRQLAPEEGAAHRAVALALRAFDPPRIDDARAALEESLGNPALEGAAERGMVEEELLRALLDLGDEASRARAREVAELLRTRPADRETQRGREPLLRAAADSTP